MKFLKIFPVKTKDTSSEGQQLALYRKTGDINLLGTLYEPYMEMVYAICYKFLKKEDESKDAVMQIFEKLVSDLKRHEVENFKSWLHSVARSHCLMQIRSRHVFIVNEEIPETYGSTEFQNEEWEHSINLNSQLDSLEKCLEILVLEQRVTVELFYKQEKCYKEISGQTGFDLNKVKSYIQNGKRNLKICMDKNGSI
ncbi:RNA polymerase sigma factor [Dyadobacter arcticus]|uniref:RNA polymerase sigma-70 factor (ECF subfamily) n=1 Tax=Dyadobacter arcticus TaxID=1078754 RepID=A0ABX0UL00_9BACT|nr:sigma-70 family RNA polymerase sigma factor [Dyadobacter arcticus]NIJ53636.1 RNA polymerase sigma-70 factor (ECF subfamily) [Dyadobacter arcticus]